MQLHDSLGELDFSTRVLEYPRSSTVYYCTVWLVRGDYSRQNKPTYTELNTRVATATGWTCPTAHMVRIVLVLEYNVPTRTVKQ